MLRAGFHRAGMDRYTGFKSSPYTEGALFYGEKLVDVKAGLTLPPLADLVAEPTREVACEPGSA